MLYEQELLIDVHSERRYINIQIKYDTTQASAWTHSPGTPLWGVVAYL